MPKPQLPERLSRFTTLPVLLDFLYRKKLVLLNPNTWEDRNDTQVILAYKEKAGIDKLFALCFTHGNETIHHWKTYSAGPSGCCIEFDAEKLISIFNANKNIRHGKVKYKKINEVGPHSFTVKEMPFIKRFPYECEQEYRVIWQGKTTAPHFEIDVPLEAVNKITISQQMPDQVFESIKTHLKKESDRDIRISRSTLFENKTWINYFKK